VSAEVQHTLLAGLEELIARMVDERIAAALAERDRPADEWLYEVGAIAAYLGCPRSRLYDAAYRRKSGVPMHKDGSRWVAKRSELDGWRRATER
jgi:hypothetical protein